MRILKLAIVLAAGLVGGSLASHAHSEPRGTLALHDCRLEHPLKLASDAARCGTLKVPEDRGKPEGPRIELQLAVVAALNRRSTAPPLFLLAGGPGQSAIDLYTSFPGAFARINRNHDIVMVDQRGTGKSAPLLCRYPDDWTDAAVELQKIREATRACLANLGDRVRNYTSSVAVRDLDEVRRALGYEKIDLYGSSYGTRMAELFMRRYPSVVQAVILDGVIDPERALGPDTPEDGERALEQIVARCGETRDCALAYPDLAQELAALRARFGPERVTLTVPDPSTGQPEHVEFNRVMLNAALRFMSYSGTQAALLPTLIHQAAQGQLVPLAAQAMMIARQVGDQLASGMQNSVVCSEDVPFFAVDAAALARMKATYQGSDQLDALREICAIWPHGPVDADLHARLQSEIPTLLLSGEADPVTPPASAERTAQGLTRHRHLVLAGEGHGQLATSCVPRLMADFLDRDEAERIDPGCLAEHTPPPFFVKATGPAP